MYAYGSFIEGCTRKLLDSGEKGTLYCFFFGNIEIFFFFTILYFENQSENICLIRCLLRIQWDTGWWERLGGLWTVNYFLLRRPGESSTHTPCYAQASLVFPQLYWLLILIGKMRIRNIQITLGPWWLQVSCLGFLLDEMEKCFNAKACWMSLFSSNQ